MMSVKGLGVSPGVARGEALVLRQRARHRYYLVPSGSVDREVARLEQARDRGRGQLEEITQRIATLAGAAPASLFEAQLLMLDDPMLLQRASDLIRARRQNAEWAVQQAGDELAEMFNQADDPYLRERKGDLQDVIGRLRMNLSGEAGSGWLVSPVGAPCIIVADDLPPSVAAQIEWTRTLGFITEVGSWTYHTAILARSLGVPAIVGIHEATRRIAPGADIILDGSTGDVFVDATDDVREELLRRRSERASTATIFSAPRDAEPVTLDGVRIRLDANLEMPDDLSHAVRGDDSHAGPRRDPCHARRSHCPQPSGSARAVVRRRVPRAVRAADRRAAARIDCRPPAHPAPVRDERGRGARGAIDCQRGYQPSARGGRGRARGAARRDGGSALGRA